MSNFTEKEKQEFIEQVKWFLRRNYIFTEIFGEPVIKETEISGESFITVTYTQDITGSNYKVVKGILCKTYRSFEIVQYTGD